MPHKNLALEFAFKFADNEFNGYAGEQLFTVTAERFKRHIVAIAISKKNETRRYFFDDGTNCIYNKGYFKLHSPSNN